MVYDGLERRRSEIERHRENSARSAVVHARFTVTGQGASEFEDVADFGLTFIELPSVAVGVVLDPDSLRDVFDLDDDDPLPLPTVTGFVTDWDRNERGFYTGAWCAANVYFDPSAGVPFDALPEIDVHFTFTAIGMKDIPLIGAAR